MDIVKALLSSPPCQWGIDYTREECNLVSNVQAEIQKLSSTATNIQKVLEVAEHNQPEVGEWLKRLEQVWYDADDTLDEVATDAVLQPEEVDATTTSLVGSIAKVLVLEGCTRLGALPRNMSRLVNLRHLVGSRDWFYGIRDLLSGIEGLGKMTALRELVVRGREVTELENMGMLEELTIRGLDEVQSKEEAAQARLNLKEHLRVLNLEWRYDPSLNPSLEEGVLEALRPVEDVRELSIYGYAGAKSPAWIVDPSSSLESVKLGYCMNWEVLPPLSQLPRLKFLRITRMNGLRRMGPDRFLGCGVDGGGGRGFKRQGFPLLEKLYLWDMPELEEWELPHVDDDQVHTTQPQQQPSFLPRLRTLHIGYCPKLRELPPLPPTLTELTLEAVGVTQLRGQFQSPEELNLTSSLPNLEKLEIDGCENLEFLPSSSSLKRLSIRNHARLHNEALSRWLRGLTSLTDLNIFDCPAITALLVGEAMCGLTTLESLDIRSCKELTSLVGSHASLVSLKSLEIDECPKLLHLVEATTSPLSSPSSAPVMHLGEFEIHRASPKQITTWLRHCASLEALEIDSCPELTCFNDNDGNDAGGELEAALLNLAPSLRAFTIMKCDNLRSLPSGLRQLSSLDELNIWYCPAIQSLPVAGLPESLNTLYIKGCGRTWKERCEREGGADWPLIRHIPRIDVDNY